MKNSTLNSRGFTLVEALVAVTIITLSIAGPLYNASRSLLAIEISKDRLTASFLAQEGIEYIRLMRDDAYLNAYRNGGANVSTSAWTDFISGSNSWSITQCVGRICSLDTYPTVSMGIGGSLAQCSGTSCPALSIYNGMYTMQSSGTASKFSRSIQVDPVGGNEELVTSIVKWNSRGTAYSITLTDHIMPWQ